MLEVKFVIAPLTSMELGLENDVSDVDPVSTESLRSVPSEDFHDRHVTTQIKLGVKVILQLVVPNGIGFLVGEIVCTLVVELVGELKDSGVIQIKEDAINAHGSMSAD